VSRRRRRDTLRDALRQVDTPHAFLEVVRSSEDAA
jgi:hypothetical protein